MSTHGTGRRTLPFLTITIEDNYFDEGGYGRSRDVRVETLLGTVTVNEYDFKCAPRNFWRALTGKMYGGWKYFRPVQYERPDYSYSLSGDGENIRNQIERNKRLEKEYDRFQKMTPHQKEQHIAYHKGHLPLEARSSYVRILETVGREEDARIVESGGYVRGVGPDEIQKLAKERHDSYVKWITGDKA